MIGLSTSEAMPLFERVRDNGKQEGFGAETRMVVLS
jgi:hypothetical protein